jgi:hypothetical protein
MNTALIALSLWLAAAGPQPAPAPVAPAAAPSDAAAASEPGSGFYGWIDEETGRLAPVPEGELLEAADWDLEQALRTDGADLLVETDATGALTVRLDGRFQSAVYGRIDADGRAVIDHDPALLEPANRP